MGAIEGARASAGPARVSARLRLPSDPGSRFGPLWPWPSSARSDPAAACAVEERGAVAREGARAVVPGPRGCFHPGGRGCSGLSPRAEVLGIPAPSKDSPQLGSRPSTAPPKPPRPGSCNAGLGKWEQRPSGAGGGGWGWGEGPSFSSLSRPFKLSYIF